MSVASQEECLGMFIDADGLLLPREWRNSRLNFDNIFQAFISLFVVISLDGYSDLMLRCMSIPAEKNLQPQVRSGGHDHCAHWRQNGDVTVDGCQCTMD